MREVLPTGETKNQCVVATVKETSGHTGLLAQEDKLELLERVRI